MSECAPKGEIFRIAEHHLSQYHFQFFSLNKYNIFFCIFQVSWIRKGDVVVLTHGTTVFTSDERVEVSTIVSLFGFFKNSTKAKIRCKCIHNLHFRLHTILTLIYKDIKKIRLHLFEK